MEEIPKFKEASADCRVGCKHLASKGAGYRLWKSAQIRAEKKGLPFSLRLSDVEEMIEASTVCPVLGIPFGWANNKLRENSPTLDKFDPKLGYTKENTSLISNLANRIKTNANTTQVGKVYVWMRKKELDKIVL